MSDTQMEPVPVHLASIAAGIADARKTDGAGAGHPVPRGVYTTFVLTADDPVQCILPADDDRLQAHVSALDNDIVIGTRNQAQAAQNTAANVPQPIGGYIPSKTSGGSIIPYPVRDCGAVFAGATTTASNSRVSVLAYYRS